MQPAPCGERFWPPRLGGCQSSNLQDVTGSIGGASETDVRRSVEELGRQHDRNPDDKANLGLSYALSKKLPQAEKTLQEAAAQHDADKPVRQNLALVLALEGKFATAEEGSAARS